MSKLRGFISKQKELFKSLDSRSQWWVESSGTGPSDYRYVMEDLSPYTTDSGVADCTVQVCSVHSFNDKKAEFIAETHNTFMQTIEALDRAITALEYYADENHVTEVKESRTARRIDDGAKARDALNLDPESEKEGV